MASDEVGKANIDEATVNDFKKLLSVHQFTPTVKENASRSYFRFKTHF